VLTAARQTLRRWELAERQRRKSAREPDRPTSAGSSVFSYFFPARRQSGAASPPTPTGGGYGLPLDDVRDAGAPTAYSPQPTPRASTSSASGHRRDGSDATVHADADPETTPTKARPSSFARSPFDDPDPHAASAVMEPSASSPPRSRAPSAAARGKRPAMLPASSYSVRRPAPPPGRIDVPAPRTPPPRAGSPVAGRPPEPHAREDEDEDEDGFADALVARDPPVRWWTDWMCGCGPHHEGDTQAGRTNPFE
jgi:hypothetical protein